MSEATIKIVVRSEGIRANCNAVLEGPTWALMIGLTSAIKELEEEVPEENRAVFRTNILKMLNDRH